MFSKHGLDKGSYVIKSYTRQNEGLRIVNFLPNISHLDWVEKVFKSQNI